MLITWFWKNFHGHSYITATSWSQIQIAELGEIVSFVACWLTNEDESEKNDARLFLSFDEKRLAECTEGWIPVHSPYGSGILIFDNCD